MCIQNSRDRYQSRAFYWRVVNYHTSQKCASCFKVLYIPLLVYSIITSLSVYILDPQLTLNSVEQFYMTSSEPSYVTNMFTPDDAYFQTNQTLQNCTIMGAQRIGLVQPTGADDANEILTGIFNDIKAMYANNMDNVYPEFEPVSFDSDEALDKYAKHGNYPDKMLCFALSWNIFDPTANEFKLNMRFNYGQTAISRYPQYEFEESTYNQVYFSEFTNTGYTQVMTTATKHILSQQYATDVDLKLMYMPISTETFRNNGLNEAIYALFPIFIATFSSIGRRIYLTSLEYHEDDVTKMLRTVGTRPAAAWNVKTTFGLTFAYLVSFLMAWIGVTFIVTAVDYKMLLSFIAMFIYNSWLLNNIINLCLGHVMAEVVEVIIEVLGIMVGIFTVYETAIQPNFVYISSVLPYMQIQWLIKFAGINFNRETTLSWATASEQVNGNNLNRMFQISAIECAVMTLIFIYLYPLKLVIDEKHHLPWYYPCAPKYWSCCGFCNKRKEESNESQVSSSEQALIGTADTEQLIERSETISKLQDAEEALVKEGIIQKPDHETMKNQKLVFSNLSVSLGHNKAIDNLNLTLFKDEVVAIVGPNGSGKTTLMKSICGFIDHVHGKIDCFGEDLLHMYHGGGMSKDLIGYCPQEPILLDKLSVTDNIRFFCKFRNIQDEEKTVKKILAEFMLEPYSKVFAAKLSQSVRKLLAFALSTLGDSQLLVLDEPTLYLDNRRKGLILQQILEKSPGRLVLVTCQDLQEAEKIASRIILWNKGKIMACNKPADLKAKYDCGFQLIVTVDDQQEDDFQMEQIVDLLQEYHFEPSRETEIMYRRYGPHMYSIKMPQSLSSSFCDIFTEFDARKTELGIVSYKIKVESLEELFVKLVRKVNGAGVNALGRHSLDESKGDQDKDYKLGSQDTGTQKTTDSNSLDQSMSTSQNQSISDLRSELYEKQSRWANFKLIFKKLIYMDFCEWHFIKMVAVLSLLLGQESISNLFRIFQKSTLIDYSDLGSIYEHNSPSRVYYNTMFPDGTEVPTTLIDNFIHTQNGNEHANENSSEHAAETIKLVPSTWVPATTESATEVIAEVSEQIKELAAEEEEEGGGGDHAIPELYVDGPMRLSAHHETNVMFGSYYFYDFNLGPTVQDQSANVAVYANMKSAAAIPAYGSSILQSIAQTATGESELKVSFVQNELPINDVILPVVQPAIAEVFGVSLMTAIIYMQNSHVKTIGGFYENSYYESYRSKGGSALALVAANYALQVMHNFTLLIIFFGMIFAFGYQTPNALLIGVLWAFVDPLFLILVFMITFNKFRKSTATKVNLILNSMSLIITGIVIIWPTLESSYLDGITQGKGILKFLTPLVFYPHFNFVISVQAELIFRRTTLIDVSDEAKNGSLMYITDEDWTTFDSTETFIVAMSLIGTLSAGYMIFHIYGGWKFLFAAKVDRELPVEFAIKQDEWHQSVKDELSRVRHQLIRDEEGKISKKTDDIIIYNLSAWFPKTVQANSVDYISVWKTSENTQGVWGLKGISFGVKEGETFALLGTSASGRTVCLRIIMGLMTRVSGNVFYDDREVSKWFKFESRIKGKIAYLAQSNACDLRLTIQEQLTLFATMGGVKEEKVSDQVDRYIELFELQEYKHVKAGVLSFGNQRRLCIAMTFIGQQQMVLLDNPMAGIDALAARKIMQSIKIVSRGRTVILSTSVPEVAQLLAKKIAIIHEGNLLKIGTKNELCEGDEGVLVALSYNFAQLRELMPMGDEDDFISSHKDALDKLEELAEILESSTCDQAFKFEEEYTEEGALNKVYEIVESGQSITLEDFTTKVIQINLITSVLATAQSEVGQATLVKQYADHFQMKISPGEDGAVQYGALYQLLETIKEELPFSTYTVQEMDLEHVFNEVTKDKMSSYFNDLIKHGQKSAGMLVSNKIKKMQRNFREERARRTSINSRMSPMNKLSQSTHRMTHKSRLSQADQNQKNSLPAKINDSSEPSKLINNNMH